MGFAAESENLLAAAREKLAGKSLDMIFANPIGVEGVGFQADANAVTLLTPQGEAIESGRMEKARVADWMWERIAERMPTREPVG